MFFPFFPNGKSTGFFSHSQPEGIFLKLSIEILLWADTKHGHFPPGENMPGSYRLLKKEGREGNDGRAPSPAQPLPRPLGTTLQWLYIVTLRVLIKGSVIMLPEDRGGRVDWVRQWPGSSSLWALGLFCLVGRFWFSNPHTNGRKSQILKECNATYKMWMVDGVFQFCMALSICQTVEKEEPGFLAALSLYPPQTPHPYHSFPIQPIHFPPHHLKCPGGWGQLFRNHHVRQALW